MSTTGIDLGSESLVVALSRRKGVDIVDNEASQRLTPSLVAYSDTKRHCGAAAFTFRTRNVRNTIFGVRNHLGADYIKGEKLNVPTTESPEGLRQFVVDAYGSSTAVYPEQATASFLKYINKMVQSANENLPIASCVFAIPGYMGLKARRALLRACTIADINCSAIVTDHFAISMNYLVKRLANFTEEPQYALFIDIGYSHASVFVTEFTNKGFRVISVKHSTDISGSAIDNMLAAQVIADVQKKYGYDITTNVRAHLRLNETVANAKKILSVNPESRYHLECLFEDTDVSGVFTLDEFNAAIGNMAAELGSMINEVITEAKIEPSQLIAAEIVGGITRIPLFQQVITSATGLQVSRGLNADECVAIGAAWTATTKSSAFSGKIKELVCSDYIDHNIKIKFNQGSDVALWKRGPLNGSNRKNVKPTMQVDTIVGSIFHDDEEVLRFEIPEAKAGESVNFFVQRDNFGGYDITAKRSVKKEITEKVKVPTSPAPTSEPTTEGIENTETPEAEKEEQFETVTKQVTETTDLKVTSAAAYDFPAEQVKKLVAIEKEMTQKDWEVDQLELAKHNLEDFCSKSRQILRGPNAHFAENPQTIIDALQEIEFWFEDYCDEASLKQINDKIEEAQKLTKNFYFLIQESTERQFATQRLAEIEQEIAGFLVTTEEAFAHIDEASREKLNVDVTTIINEVKRLIESTEASPKHAAPKITAKEIDEKISTIKSLYWGVKNTPAPKKEEPAPETTESPEEQAEQS